uniref:Ras association and DIL domains n=1 Tax=Acanthochromis polyacanthus TaxID=80966 RepID=A0A3Q1EGQ7_9TELE
MFYGSSSGASMSLPSKSRLKRQSRTFTQVLTQTPRPADDPAELSTQSSAPGVLKIFGDEICAGANYKSVLATPRSSAQELVKEALERYSLNKNAAHCYVLCDVIGRLECGGGIGGGGWRTECLRALGDNEKPLLLQELWKPREGHARRFELRRRAEVEELNAKEKDTITAGEKTYTQRYLGMGEEPKRYYSTLPGPFRGREHEMASSGRRKEEGSQGGGGVRHSLYQSPHLLLLQGFNRQDCLVYLLNREQHTVGQETPSARPNICLFSPDILPLHCRLRRVPTARRHAVNSSTKGEELPESQRSCVAVEPVLNATVLVNFSRCERSTTLRHGDLLSFGAHYIFLYKDPTGAKPLPAQTLARLRTLGVGTMLQLEFDLAHEDQLLNRIVSLIEPGGDDHKLTPAYLLCMCIQHSASTFPPGSFGKLLLKIVRRIQTIAWEKTKELAQKQAHQDPASLSLLSISDLVPDLQTIFFWMSNSIEILYFIQQRAPAYTHSIETLQGILFHGTVHLFVDVFPLHNNVSVHIDMFVCLQVFQNAQELLHGYQVHPEIQAQMFAYLFFFSNVSLFNQLMDKGPSRGWFQRSKVLQIQACLQMVMEWASRSGLGHLADKFFTKLNSTVSILATPPQQLTQAGWRALSSEHPTLKPVQLHRILTQYQLTAEIGSVPVWQPSSEDEAYIYRTGTCMNLSGRMNSLLLSEPLTKIMF